MADNAPTPVAAIKSGIKSAFSIKFFVAVIAVLFLGLVALDYFGKTETFFKPLTAFKRWNEARKAKAATT